MAQAFRSRPLPPMVAVDVRSRLARAHAAEPFSTTDPRATIRRVRELVADLPVHLQIYRGGLDLRGAEVDHVWLAVSHADNLEGEPAVVDVAFPLFDDAFVSTLRRFVAGDAQTDDLAAAATLAGLDARVLGVFPAPMRYVGQPLWRPASGTTSHIG